MLRKHCLKNIGLFVFLLFSLHCSARTIIVNDTNDTIKGHSLRGAVLEANRRGGQNTIILGEGLNKHNQPGQWIYHLTIHGSDEAAGLKGDLNITRGELTIVGASSNVTIDATGLGDRVFQISSNAHLTLENLTITGGTAPQAEMGSFYMPTRGPENGGAIYNAGKVVLENCIFINNSSGAGNFNPGNTGGIGGGDGGAIYNSGTLSASNCVIAGNLTGAGFDGASGGNGGGIRNDGDCILKNCIVSRNKAGSGGSPAGNALGFGGYGGNGGGIFNSGTITLEQCMISANAAGQGADGGDPGIGSIFSPGGPGGSGGNGGGIYNLGQLEIDFTTIDGNDGGNGGNGQSSGAGGNSGSGGNGGGIFNAGLLDLNTSTISSNSCGNGGNGGGGFTGGGVSGGAGGNGGGIYNSGVNGFWGLNAGSLELTSSTVTLNMCGAGGNGGNGVVGADSTPVASGGSGGSGGGILNGAGDNSIIMRNTLMAQNLANVGGAGGTNSFGGEVTAPGQPPPPPPPPTIIGNPGADGTGFDLAGGFTSGGYNFVSTGDGSTGFVNGINADQVGTDANPIDSMLGPLQFNGGPTPTHALLWGSPAIDHGYSFGVHTDQRGNLRPYIYFPGFSGDGSDIGAFELSPN